MSAPTTVIADGISPHEMARRVETVVAELRRGRPVLVVDHQDRENEGDLILSAEKATSETIGFMIRHTSGILCVAITEERADELALPLMVSPGDDPRGTAFTVSVDHKSTTTTGISAADRTSTIRALADPAVTAADFSRPGHVFPLRARPGGVLRRAGHTECAVDLCRLAGLSPAGVLAEVTNDDGSIPDRSQLAAFGERHGLATLSLADLAAYRKRTETLIRREACAQVPTEHGTFTVINYRDLHTECEHVAFVMGEVDQVGDADDPVLVRVHSECLTGDVLGSRRCDCGEQLDRAMRRIAVAGRGIIVYLRGHEGRGIGLTHKLRAYSLQDSGLDTVDANLVQGLPVEARDFGAGAQILRELGVRTIRMMTNNPAKYRGVAENGIHIAAREPLIVPPNPDSMAYLYTKHTRLNHALME